MVRVPVLRLTSLLASFAVLSPAAAQEAGPTFDCLQASGQIETLICGDDELAALDRRMAEVWAAALEAWPDDIVAEQRAYQRGWIGGRNECWKDDDPRACTEESYLTRIVELQIKSGQLTAPTPRGFVCAEDDSKPFTAIFYQETDPPSAVLTYGGDQVIAFLSRSASGARYTAANVEFWEHQGEASLAWFGTTVTCVPRASTSHSSG